MAITLNSNKEQIERTQTGSTDTNEVIFETYVNKKYSIQAYPTSAGTASLKTHVETAEPADFTNMSEDTSGSQSDSFQRIVEGATFVGLDVASGTWNVIIRQI